jgi:hypothetical protein
VRFATDKADSKRISSDIRGVLLNFWDPIGIKNEPIAQDEYNSYIGGVYELLKRSCTDEELAAHLWKIIEERIEIQPAKGATERTVSELRRIRLD